MEPSQKEGEGPVKLHGYDFWRSIGEPKYICAPMVDQSELPFRLLTRRHGCQLAYTPMLHSRMMLDGKGSYKSKFFSTCQLDRPLFAHFCGNDPETLLNAAKMLEGEADAIDINFGCPQGIARKGHYGSFLLNEPDLIYKLINILHLNLQIPVTCKIRVLPSEEQTMELVQKIQDAGCSVLAVHGRVKEQNKDAMGPCNWDIVKKIKERLKIPVICNGGIYTFEDVQRCFDYTNCDAVMSAEALLENPALFSGKIHDLDDLALEYMDICKTYPTGSSEMKSHLFKMLHSGLKEHTDLRDSLSNSNSYEQFLEVAQKIKERRKDVPINSKFGWYLRYQSFKKPNGGQNSNQKQKQEAPEDKIQSENGAKKEKEDEEFKKQN